MLYDLIFFKKFDSNKNSYRRKTQLNMFERKNPKMKGLKQKTLLDLRYSICQDVANKCQNYILSHLNNPNKDVVS